MEELKSKYEQALAKYNCNVAEAAVAAAVKKIIDERVLRTTQRKLRNSS